MPFISHLNNSLYRPYRIIADFRHFILVIIWSSFEKNIVYVEGDGQRHISPTAACQNAYEYMADICSEY